MREQWEYFGLGFLERVFFYIAGSFDSLSLNLTSRCVVLVFQVFGTDLPTLCVIGPALRKILQKYYYIARRIGISY